METSLDLLDLGLIDYEEALEVQLQTLEQVHADQRPGTLIFCQHPEVVTLGRASTDSEIQGWKGKTIPVSRGGKATYHGPSQLIVYPIFNLNFQQGNYPKKDIHWYLRSLEAAVIATLKTYQISATTNAPHTGVWVNGKKICSMGIAVKSWIAYHGLALNVWNDPNAFEGIAPCGFSKSIMTNLEDELHKHKRETPLSTAINKINLETLKSHLLKFLVRALEKPLEKSSSNYLTNSADMMVASPLTTTSPC